MQKFHDATEAVRKFLSDDSNVVYVGIKPGSTEDNLTVTVGLEYSDEGGLEQFWEIAGHPVEFEVYGPQGRTRG